MDEAYEIDGIWIGSADVIHTINSEKVGNTVSASVSVVVEDETLPLDYIASWEMYINNEYIATAELFSVLNQQRMVNYAVTQEFTGQIDDIYFLGRSKGLDDMALKVKVYPSNTEAQPAPNEREQVKVNQRGSANADNEFVLRDRTDNSANRPRSFSPVPAFVFLQKWMPVYSAPTG